MRQAHFHIISLMILALTYSAQAQETSIAEYRDNKVKAVRNSGSKSTSHYDKTGRITMTTMPRDNKRTDTTFFLYNQNGNNIRIINRHFVGSTDTQREFIDNYTYDDLNRLIEKMHFTNQIIDEKEFYFYNSCGNLDSVQTFYNYNASMDDGSKDSMIFNGTKCYFYNAARQLVRKTYQRSTWNYEYDKVGQLIKEISSSMYQPCFGKEFQVTQIAKYSYKAGKVIAIDYEYSTEDNQIMPKHQTKYEYLSNGLKSKEINYSWIPYNSTELKNDTTTTLEYSYDYW